MVALMLVGVVVQLVGSVVACWALGVHGRRGGAS